MQVWTFSLCYECGDHDCTIFPFSRSVLNLSKHLCFLSSWAIQRQILPPFIFQILMSPLCHHLQCDSRKTYSYICVSVKST